MLGSILYKAMMEHLTGARVMFDRNRNDLVKDAVEHHLNAGILVSGRILARRGLTKATTSLFYPKALDADVEALARRASAFTASALNSSTTTEARLHEVLKAEYLNGRKLSAVVQDLEKRNGVIYG